MLIIQKPTIEAIGDEKANRQAFSVGPLDPGFGHTLGNSLRRTLLSSIPGAAATKVKFDAVLHEFDVIEGVKEDVQDICLNLKDLLLRVHSTEPVVLRLDKKGEGAVTAADLSASADVEILNPDLHIATITEESGELEMEIIVSRGRGFVTTEDRGKEKEIGVIAIDSIFTPVKNVGYQVVDTRVGQITNFDKLILTVETDGTITAKDAIEQATKLLLEHFELLRDLSGKEGTVPAELAPEASAEPVEATEEEPKKAKKKKSE